MKFLHKKGASMVEPEFDVEYYSDFHRSEAAEMLAQEIKEQLMEATESSIDYSFLVDDYED
jgi:hypothetical protein